MGARNLDRIPLRAYRASCETLHDMQERGWDVISCCQKCGLSMAVDLDVLIWKMGAKASLWNRRAKCRRIGCDGVVDFRVKLAGKGYYEPLDAPWPEEKPPAPHWPPRPGEPLSATLGGLAAQDGSVHINCRHFNEAHRKASAYGLTIKAADAAKRWGGETTLAELQRASVCRVCGARGRDVLISCSTPNTATGAGDF